VGTATWTFQVGTGDRTFSVTAYDAAGNKTTSGERTIHLGGDTTPPTSGQLTVSVTDPTPETQFNPGDLVTVNATVAGSDVSTVTLDWVAPSGRAQFPMSPTDQPGVFSVTVQLRTDAVSGPRNLTVTARDTSGGSGSGQLTLEVP
jgi:hypothetical protein